VTSHGDAYARFQRALKSGTAHLALAAAAAADLRQVALADALSLLLLIREDKPVLYDKAAVRWFAKYAAEDRHLLVRDARELIELLEGSAGPNRSRLYGLSGGYGPAATTRRLTGLPTRRTKSIDPVSAHRLAVWLASWSRSVRTIAESCAFWAQPSARTRPRAM
jgi:hypothetical protein